MNAIQIIAHPQRNRLLVLHVAVDIVHGLDRGLFGARIEVVIQVQTAHAPRAVGQLKGIDQVAKAVVRPAPQIGVNVLVDDRRVILQATFGRPEQRAQAGQGRIGPGQHGLGAVDVFQA
ncbi:hypothetical protein D3C72_1977940 [compost metagenome]